MNYLKKILTKTTAILVVYLMLINTLSPKLRETAMPPHLKTTYPTFLQSLPSLGQELDYTYTTCLKNNGKSRQNWTH